MIRSLRFSRWATPVVRRRWAFVSVILHRLQRITAPRAHWGRRALEPAATGASTTWLHRLIRRAEVAAWHKATTHGPGARYLLSKIVPVRMRSTYTVNGTKNSHQQVSETAAVHTNFPDQDYRERATWIQWRGRVFAHRAVMLPLLVVLTLLMTAAPAFAADAAPGDNSGLGTVLGAVAALGVVAATIKVVSLVRSIVDQNWRKAIWTVAAWAGAFLVVLLYAQTRFALGVDVGGFDLASADLAECAVLGISYGSAASVAFDALSQQRP